jgi:hypothetical protein
VFKAIRQSTGLMRHVWLTMATLAIALKIIIPPGFMAGPPTTDLPFALVLCTAQGAMVVDAGDAARHGDQDSAPASADAPCLFAGLAAAAPPPVLTDAGAIEFVAYDFTPQAAAPDLAPRRGLTGPPLPARGPPTQLI